MGKDSLQKLEKLLQQKGLLEDAVLDEINEQLQFYLKVRKLLTQGISYNEMGSQLGMSGNKVAQYVHKYPALSDGKVDLRGKRSRSGQERVYGEVKRLVESGLSCIEIAKNRGITRQAVHDYLRHHPELKEPLEERKNDF